MPSKLRTHGHLVSLVVIKRCSSISTLGLRLECHSRDIHENFTTLGLHAGDYTALLCRPVLRTRQPSW